MNTTTKVIPIAMYRRLTWFYGSFCLLFAALAGVAAVVWPEKQFLFVAIAIAETALAPIMVVARLSHLSRLESKQNKRLSTPE